MRQESANRSMDPQWAPYGLMAELLDSLNIAVCLFDDDDCTVLWNRTFLRHEGQRRPRVRPRREDNDGQLPLKMA